MKQPCIGDEGINLIWNSGNSWILNRRIIGSGIDTLMI